MVNKMGSWSNYVELHTLINNLGWAIRDQYGHQDHDLLIKLIPKLDVINVNDFLSRFKECFDKDKAINALWHSWYAECDLNFPSVGAIESFDDFKDFSRDNKDPLTDSALSYVNRLVWKTKQEYSAWKLIKAYYCVFFSVSSFVRIINNKAGGGHTTKLNLFKHAFYASSFKKDFFPYPFNIYLINDDASTTPPEDDKHFEYITNSLRKIKDISKGYYQRLDMTKFTIPDALFLWRNRINYTSVYSFLKCYGQSYKSFFFNDLHRIVFMFNIITEIFLIKCFGYKAIKEEYDSFSELLKKSGLKAHPVDIRFTYYKSQMLSNKEGYFSKILPE